MSIVDIDTLLHGLSAELAAANVIPLPSIQGRVRCPIFVMVASLAFTESGTLPKSVCAQTPCTAAIIRIKINSFFLMFIIKKCFSGAKLVRIFETIARY